MQRRQVLAAAGTGVGIAAAGTTLAVAGCLERDDRGRRSPTDVVEGAWSASTIDERAAVLHSKSPILLPVPGASASERGEGLTSGQDSDPITEQDDERTGRERFLWATEPEMDGDPVDLTPRDVSLVETGLGVETLQQRLDMPDGDVETVAGQTNARVKLAAEMRGAGVPDGATLDVPYVVAVEEGQWLVVDELPVSEQAG